MTARNLLDEFPSSLKVLLEAARDTVMDRDTKRICSVSAMAFLNARLINDNKALWGLSNCYREMMKFDPETNDNLDNYIATLSGEVWCRDMKHWENIGKRLRQSNDDDSSGLADIIDGYAKEGGYRRLLETLRAHIDAHGRRNQLERLERDFNEFQRRWGNLPRQVASLPDPETPQPVPGERNGNQQFEAVQKLKVAFESLQNYVGGRTFRLVSRDGNQDANESANIRPNNRLEDMLRRNLVSRIFKWKEWRLLLGRLDQDNTVRLVDPNDDEIKYEHLRQQERDTPTKSTDFHAPFTDTLSSFDKQLRQFYDESFGSHLEELGLRLAETLGGRADVSRLSEVLDERQKAWLDIGLKDNSDSAEIGGGDLDAFFPLQKEDATFYYAWHATLNRQYPHQFHNRHRHFMYVVRLRQSIVDAAIMWLDNRLSECGASLSARLSERIAAIYNEVSRASDQADSPRDADEEMFD